MFVSSPAARNRSPWRARPGRLVLWAWALGWAWLACTAPVWAQTPTGGASPVGRISEARSPAWLDTADADEHVEHGRESLLNWPVTQADRLGTGRQGRMELEIGTTRLRLGENTRAEIRRLDHNALVLDLREGTASVWVRQASQVDRVRILTRRATIVPLGPTLVRVDLAPEGAWDARDSVTAWRAAVEVRQNEAFVRVHPGQRVQLFPEGGWRLGSPESDEFARWGLDTAEPPITDLPADLEDVTGAQSLAAHGRWTRAPEHGWIWTPLHVGVAWEPYREGRWVWRVSWGWTWVDAAPWGFAPFHYGRWVMWNGAWGWVPDRGSRPPTYVPANRPPPPHLRVPEPRRPPVQLQPPIRPPMGDRRPADADLETRPWERRERPPEHLPRTPAAPPVQMQPAPIWQPPMPSRERIPTPGIGRPQRPEPTPITPTPAAPVQMQPPPRQRIPEAVRPPATSQPPARDSAPGDEDLRRRQRAQ